MDLLPSPPIGSSREEDDMKYLAPMCLIEYHDLCDPFNFRYDCECSCHTTHPQDIPALPPNAGRGEAAAVPVPPGTQSWSDDGLLIQQIPGQLLLPCIA